MKKQKNKVNLKTFLEWLKHLEKENFKYEVFESIAKAA